MDLLQCLETEWMLSTDVTLPLINIGNKPITLEFMKIKVANLRVVCRRIVLWSKIKAWSCEEAQII